MSAFSLGISILNTVVFVSLFCALTILPVPVLVSLLGGWACGAGFVYSVGSICLWIDLHYN